MPPDLERSATAGGTAVSADRPACRHCSRKPVNRPRGLCRDCYYTPAVCALYPPTSKYARKGTGIGHRTRAPLPAEPTRATPGTPEKMAVLARRAERGEQLFHPEDGP